MTTFKIIACSTVKDEVEALRGDIPVEYLEGFLHDTPDVLRATINERIAAVLLLEPALDENYERVKADTYPWPGG